MGVHYVDVELPLFCFRLSAFAVVVNLSLSCLAFILVRRRMHRDVRLNGHAIFTGPSVFGDLSLITTFLTEFFAAGRIGNP